MVWGLPNTVCLMRIVFSGRYHARALDLNADSVFLVACQTNRAGTIVEVAEAMASAVASGKAAAHVARDLVVPGHRGCHRARCHGGAPA